MSRTKFLVGRSELDMQDNFYPEDLPSEWRFDYYSAMFKALSLPIDSDEDLLQIFVELEESDEEFELILSIDIEKFNDRKKLSTILLSLSEHKEHFTIYCEIEEEPSKEFMSALIGYNYCLKLLKPLDIKTNKVFAVNQHLYFNYVPVFYSAVVWDEKKIRSCLEEISEINSRTVLICKDAESETLNRIRIISELLGF